MKWSQNGKCKDFFRGQIIENRLVDCIGAIRLACVVTVQMTIMRQEKPPEVKVYRK